MCSNIIDLRYFVLNFLSKPVIGLLFKRNCVFARSRVNYPEPDDASCLTWPILFMPLFTNKNKKIEASHWYIQQHLVCCTSIGVCGPTKLVPPVSIWGQIYHIVNFTMCCMAYYGFLQYEVYAHKMDFYNMNITAI